MPSWHQLLEEIKVKGSTFDVVRRNYLKRLQRITGRNVVLYYSGWLQKPGIPGMQVNDADKNGFMTVIHGLDRSKGLDLILHTPGGETAATESIVDYLYSMFGTNIRAFVPQLAMSAGTMIACACKEIVMGKQSSLGPIDPQFGNLPAHGVVEEFKRAAKEISEDPSRIPLWQPIIAKYHPTLIGECEKAIQWSNDMVKEWLARGMLKDCDDPISKAAEVAAELSDHALTKSHARHLSAEKCRSIGLNVSMLEESQRLQDAVLTVHHACVHTLSSTPAFKLIENHKGVAFIQIAQTMLVQGPSGIDAAPRIELVPPSPEDQKEPIPSEQESNID
ncbi:MAG TPA: S49 family peptidase [Deltaproteobacteria bacterium]|nr:S49 family peptidase [Alphaproteobacteria bacterium]HPR52275.1 S49 family peptidase [Deltaproteobacteria bacterium]